MEAPKFQLPQLFKIPSAATAIDTLKGWIDAAGIIIYSPSELGTPREAEEDLAEGRGQASPQLFFYSVNISLGRLSTSTWT